MAGGMGVRKNIHIENWASYRENCEHYFKFSRGNWTRLAIFGFGVPIAAYLAITSELVRIFEPTISSTSKRLVRAPQRPFPSNAVHCV